LRFDYREKPLLNTELCRSLRRSSRWSKLTSLEHNPEKKLFSAFEVYLAPNRLGVLGLISACCFVRQRSFLGQTWQVKRADILVSNVYWRIVSCVFVEALARANIDLVFWCLSSLDCRFR